MERKARPGSKMVFVLKVIVVSVLILTMITLGVFGVWSYFNKDELKKAGVKLE